MSNRGLILTAYTYLCENAFADERGVCRAADIDVDVALGVCGDEDEDTVCHGVLWSRRTDWRAGESPDVCAIWGRLLLDETGSAWGRCGLGRLVVGGVAGAGGGGERRGMGGRVAEDAGGQRVRGGGGGERGRVVAVRGPRLVVVAVRAGVGHEQLARFPSYL